MVRRILVTLVGVVALLAGTTQIPARAEDSPSVSISLPSSVPSKTVQISYFLVGPFGGEGGYTTDRTGVHSYEISTMVDFQAATEIRMIVYAPGCEIQQFVIPLTEHSRVSQEFPCQPVETVKLSGHILPDALVRDTNAELVVTYMGYWAHAFYGIADGLLLGFTSQPSLRTLTGCFKSTCPISASTLRLLLRNKEPAFG